MITKSQQKWLDHLRTDDNVIIKPYDPNSPKIFGEVKNKVISVLGDVSVEHRGASALGISGQDEIDIYVPVDPAVFNKTVNKMARSFGKPASLYPMVRARFPIVGFGKHIDVFVINEKDGGWIDSEVFTDWLLTHPGTLEEYRKLKEESVGLSTKDYYTKKIEFINSVLELAK